MQPPPRDLPVGPPTLRVVPPAPDVETEEHAGAERAPSPATVAPRRAVGARDVPDWADVLFGSAPADSPQSDRASE